MLYVLDQNFMRRPALAALIAAAPRAKFVIPDTGLVEMVKSENWQETFRLSFEVLTPVVNRCFMSMSVQEARETEVQRRDAITGALLPAAGTELLRGSIVDSQARGGRTLASVKASIEQVRTELQANELSLASNRAEFMSTVDALLQKLNASEMKAVRQNGDGGRIARLGLAQSFGDAFYVAHMEKVGVPGPVLRRLWKAKGMNRRWCYMRAHHALQWIGRGGLDSLPDKALVNDTLDQDYVLIGSFFDGVLSHETRVKDAVVDLKVMLALPPSVNAPVRVKGSLRDVRKTVQEEKS